MTMCRNSGPEMRLFFSIELPPIIHGDLACLPAEIPQTRWIPATNLHLTLQFIGDVSKEAALEIKKAVTPISETGFVMRLTGVGAFPDQKRPSVLWVGVEADEALINLQRAIFSALQLLDLHLEKRRFAPHITIARIRASNRRGSRPDISSWLETNRAFGSKSFNVTEFHLFSSELRPSGAIYRSVATYPLLGGF